MLYAMACDFGQRPSQFFEGLNEFQALTLDYRVAEAGWAYRKKQQER